MHARVPHSRSHALPRAFVAPPLTQWSESRAHQGRGKEGEGREVPTLAASVGLWLLHLRPLTRQGYAKGQQGRRSVQPAALMQEETNINHSSPCGSRGCALMLFGGVSRGHEAAEAARMLISFPASSRPLRPAPASGTQPPQAPMRVHTHRHTLSSPHLGFTPRADHSLFLVEFLGKWELHESTFMEIHLVSGTSIGCKPHKSTGKIFFWLSLHGWRC